MSDRADSLLRAFVNTVDVSGKEKWRNAAGELACREPWISLADEVRAYLNEKPHEPSSDHVCGLQGYNGMIDPPCPGCERNRVNASPPHAAAEPEKPMEPKLQMLLTMSATEAQIRDFADLQDAYKALAAKSAEPEKPVAWMYTLAGVEYDNDIRPIVTTTRWDQLDGYTETPLYAAVQQPIAPPREPDALDMQMTIIAAALSSAGNYILISRRALASANQYVLQRIDDPSQAVIELRAIPLKSAGE